MDIRCGTCGEPWDFDSLHDMEDPATGEVLPYEAALHKFQGDGCEAFGTTHNEDGNKAAAHVAALLMEVLGDDMDGVASELADAEWLGVF